MYFSMKILNVYLSFIFRQQQVNTLLPRFLLLKTRDPELLNDVAQKKKYDENNKPTLAVIQKVGQFVQECEEWNLLVEDTEVKLEREEEIEAPEALPEPPKKSEGRRKPTSLPWSESIVS